MNRRQKNLSANHLKPSAPSSLAHIGYHPAGNPHHALDLSTHQRSKILGDGQNEESIVDLELDKNITKIDYEKMKQVTKERHARKADGKPYECGDVCYGFNAGSHQCCGTSEKADTTKFGVGVLLYFKFIKHLIFFFTIFVILSLPALVLYYTSYMNFYSSKESLSYIDLLTATTVGSVGLGTSSCGVSKYPGSTSELAKKTITFECPTGSIQDPESAVYGFVEGGSTCSFIEEGDIDISCNKYNATALITSFEASHCIGSSKCSVVMPENIFQNPSSNSKCTGVYGTKNVYMKISCSDDSITVFGKWALAKKTVAFIVAIADAIIIVLLMIMIYTLKFAQKSAARNVLKKAYSASSYTLDIRNLPQTMPSEELAAKLWTFIDNKLGPKAVQSGHRVVDVQVVLPNKLIDDSKRVGEVIRKKNFLTRQFMQLYVPDYPKSHITFKGLTQVMEGLKNKRFPKLHQAEKLYKKIKALAIKKKKLSAEIQQLKISKNVRLVSAFITFSSIPARDKIRAAFNSSPIDRFFRVFCNCCYSKDISFYGKILTARSASDPGSILWENLGEPGPKVFLRRAVSALLTLALWALSGGILIVSTYYKNVFKKSYPTLDCTKVSPNLSQAAVSADYNLGELQTGLLGCYCEADIIGRLNQLFPNSGDQALCAEWFKNKVIENAVTFGIVFIVLIINFVVQFIFQTLSKFEKHSTMNKELSLRVIKTFVAQFLNTGLLILVVNAKIDGISFWQGEFRDITPLWYENVGSTLLSTMAINIISVPAVKLAGILFERLRRCCDRRCGSDEKITKKKTQVSYENLYTGPEFIIDFRYSQMLTLIFVCFLYSGGMPFLYVTSLFQLIVTFYFDKLFLLKLNKLPKNYDENLESVVRFTLYFILIGHLVFAIFMLGNPQVFEQTQSAFEVVTTAVTSVTTQIALGSESIPTKFFKRILLQHNIILFIILVVIIIVFLVKGVLLDFLKKTIFAVFSKEETDEIRKTGKGDRKVSPHDLPNYTFFHVIKSADIASLIKLTKVSLKTTMNEELTNHQKRKLALLKQEYLLKKKHEESGKVDSNINFIGFYTYDVRLHPSYKSQFAIEEMLEEENLN